MCEECVCISSTERRCYRSFTPDPTERVLRLLELQQATVFAQFGDERQKTEQQPVGSLLLLLLLDLKHKTRVSMPSFPRVSNFWSMMGANVSPHVFVVVRVYLFLQQRQQGVHATGKLLVLHLHKETADLSPETPQAGLRGTARGFNDILRKII